MIGDNWVNVMYKGMLAGGGISSIYFITLVMFGNIIMLNLFLAILLGNFDKARDFGNKKKMLECFVSLKNNGYDLSLSLDYILDDMSMHIKRRELKWDNRIINSGAFMEDSFIRSIVG